MDKDLRKNREEKEQKDLPQEIDEQTLVLDEIVHALSETISDLNEIKESEADYLLAESLTRMPEDGIDFREATRSFEINLIRKALRLAKGNQTKAAKLLKMNVTTLNAAIKRHKIET